MLAAESPNGHGKTDVIQLLLDRGADVSLLDVADWSAFSHLDIVALDPNVPRVVQGIKALLKAQPARHT
jgi:hypothetical protein